ncbi:MAG: acyltransferase family protein [Butyrivibrio sp.]|nr:acyltransferase family protein [Butyrivibrio sp.]
MEKIDSSKRTAYFDYLRVIATFAVMVLHISAHNWGKVDVTGHEWGVLNFADSITRWAVPVFVMISGALFLEREITVKKLYSKYILRMACAFAFWSFVYALYYHKSLFDFLKRIIKGNYHMWFVLMIIGIYMCIPFIKPIAESMEKTRYFLALSFAFAFFIPWIITILTDFGSDRLKSLALVLNDTVDRMNMYFVLGYAGYFILGYYLNKVSLSKKTLILICVLGGVTGFTFTICASLAASVKTGAPCSNYYEYLSVNVLLEAMAVFLLFKHLRYGHEKLNAIISKMGRLSFGAYLVHPLILDILDKYFGLNSLAFTPELSIICVALIAFVVSFAISCILSLIPVANRYIV